MRRRVSGKVPPFDIKSKYIRYLALAVAFVIGITGGAFAVNGLSNIQLGELDSYFRGFLQLADKESFNNSELFILSFKENARFVFLLWLAGITVIGIPFIYVLISARGFVTGFSSGLFIKCLGAKGSFFAMASMLPGELILVPCFIILAANGLFFSFNIVKSGSLKDSFQKNIKSELIRYCLLTVFIGLLVAGGCLVDSYVSPVLIRIVLPAIITAKII